MSERSASPPEIEALDFSSDFTRFLLADVSAAEHRAALRHLWQTSSLFGRFDGLDVYRGDYRTCALTDKRPDELEVS